MGFQWMPLGAVLFLLALLGLPPGSKGLRCYKCKESIGCYRNPGKVIEDCGDGPKWNCLTAITFYYVPFARRGCISDGELSCYLDDNVTEYPNPYLAPAALKTISKVDYWGCYKAAKPDIEIKPLCLLSGRQEADDDETTTQRTTTTQAPQNKTRGEYDWRYSIHACSEDLCNATPSPAAISSLGNWKLTSGAAVLLYIVTTLSI